MTKYAKNPFSLSEQETQQLAEITSDFLISHYLQLQEIIIKFPKGCTIDQFYSSFSGNFIGSIFKITLKKRLLNDQTDIEIKEIAKEPFKQHIMENYAYYNLVRDEEGRLLQKK